MGISLIRDKFPKVALKYSKSEFVSCNFVILFDKIKLFEKSMFFLKYIMHCDVISMIFAYYSKLNFSRKKPDNELL